MDVLVATDGRLSPDFVADYAAPLAGAGGNVTVLTVVEVPRRFLTEMREVFGEQAPTDVVGDQEYVEAPPSGSSPFGWPGDVAMIERYLTGKEEERCSAIIEALQAAGVNAASKVIESENAASAILEEAKTSGSDVIVLGSHGQGRFDGLMGSIGTKVARHAACPVLVLRNPGD